MDARTFRSLLSDGPDDILLDAVDSGQDDTVILPLLEAELARSAYRLQRLKEYRNALTSPMYRLHQEILSKIFYIYAEDNDKLFNLRWTRLLFVCRRWHDIAMSTLKLWSFIDISTGRTSHYAISHRNDEYDARDVKRVEVQRSRAALSPLTVRMRLYAHLSTAKLAYVSMNWNPDTLCSLNVHGETLYMEKIVRGLTGHRYSALKTLELHCASPVNMGPEFARLQSSLNAALRDNIPQLLHLSISGLPLHWAYVHDLRTLCVAYQNLPVGFPTSFALHEVVEALSRCPRLDFLSLKLPDHHPKVIPSPASIVALPHIDAIVAEAATAVCIHLLQAMSYIPSTTKLVIRTTDEANELPIALNMGSHAAREGAPIIRSLAIGFALVPTAPIIIGEDGLPNFSGPDSRLEIVGRTATRRISRGAFNPWIFEQEPHELPSISLDTLTRKATEAQILISVVQSWPLSKVTHLDMRFSNFGFELLDAVFAEVPEVTTLVITPESVTAHTLLTILYTELREHGRRVLKHIVLDAAGSNHYTMAMHPEWDSGVSTSAEVRARRFLIRLSLYCEKAARMGVPLSTIEIFNEPHESMFRLMGPTEEVDWRELYRNLQHGFVYDGLLHSENPDLDGQKWDTYV